MSVQEWFWLSFFPDLLVGLLVLFRSLEVIK
jgi:hypothetical protein